MGSHDLVKNLKEYRERVKHQASTQIGSVCVLLLLVAFAVLARLEE